MSKHSNSTSLDEGRQPSSTDEALDQAFAEQLPLYGEIARLGVPAYMASLPDLAKAFTCADRTLGCMDERDDCGVRAAGSLCLLDRAEQAEFCRKARVTGITSHAECGAVALLHRDGRQLDPPETLEPDQLDQYAQETVEAMAKDLGIPYLGFIGLEGMSGLSGSHIARTIYYVGVEGFNPTLLPDKLPIGFVVDRLYHQPRNALREVDVCLSIILGQHGFDGRIDKENPIYIVPVAAREGDFTLDKLSAELVQLVDQYPGLVRLEGFVQP